jgi:uncharacterized SAM-binding protein YcdF (DUF218 family)
MLFWLKKALTIPFLPLYFTLLAGIAGLLLLGTKNRKLARVLITAAILVLAVFSNTGVARLLIAPLESRYPAIPEIAASSTPPAPIAACHTVVVLGGGHSDSPALSRVNQLSPSALSRLTEGLRLARLLPDSTLIVSGYNGSKQESHAYVLEQAAVSLGFPATRIQRLDTTRDTDDEAQQLAQRLGEQPFLLVTSAWHMPRAMALCQKAGLRPVPAPADFMLRPDADKDFGLLTWDLGALERSTMAIHERLGLLWARLARGF